ncbi:MAG: tetratricopeptide repeat protein [Nitrospirae bacterium]|nr:tetratricopeptide repeat protein [Nitrospirota bacterium]
MGVFLYSYIPVSKTNTPKAETAAKEQQEIYLLNGRNYLYEGKNKEAEEAFKKVLSINPRNVKAMGALGTLYYRKGNMDMAYHYWKEALKVSPDDKIIGGLVKAIERDNLMSGSLYHMEIKTVDHAQSWEKHFADGQNLYLKGDYKEAIEELKKAKDLKPDDSKIYFVLGASYLKVRDRENTLKMWETAIKLNPDDKMIKELLNKLKKKEAVSLKMENTAN